MFAENEDARKMKASSPQAKKRGSVLAAATGRLPFRQKSSSGLKLSVKGMNIGQSIENSRSVMQIFRNTIDQHEATKKRKAVPPSRNQGRVQNTKTFDPYL